MDHPRPRARAAIPEVEALCADTGYPQTRFDAGALAAAGLLRRVGHGDIAEMGVLLAQAVPPVTRAVMLATGPELTGRVVTYRWPVGGPPGEPLGPSGQRVEYDAETVGPEFLSAVRQPVAVDGREIGGRCLHRGLPHGCHQRQQTHHDQEDRNPYPRHRRRR